MPLTFDQLGSNLNLSAKYSHAEQLEALESWCWFKVSRDVRYLGEPAAKYANYRALAKDYLDSFLPAVSTDLFKSLAVFNGMNTLQYAAYSGYDRFLSDLKTTYSDTLDANKVSGMTALHFAALRGNVHALQSLLDLGATADKANNNKQFPIQSALILPIFSEDFDALIQRKIKIFNQLKTLQPSTIKAVDNNGENVAHLMAINGFDTLIASLIKENNSLLFLANNHSKYPIHLAILNKQLKVVELLLTIPDVINLQDAEGRNALHYAAEYGDKAMLQACCAVSANLNSFDKLGRSPLILAAIYGNLEAIKLLVAKGAEPNLTDYQGLNFLQHATINKREELVSWIIKNSPPTR